MNLTTMLLVGLQGLLTVLVVIPFLRRRATRSSSGQRVAEFHHTHRTPVPRLGGVALAVGFLGVALTSLIFFADSWGQSAHRTRDLGRRAGHVRRGPVGRSATVGRAAQIGGANPHCPRGVRMGLRIDTVSNPLAPGQIALGGWGALATVVWLVAMTNLVNLIDGIDGLAGGICLMLMALLVYVQRSMDAFPMIACGMMGGLIAFLIFNFPPAKI